MARYLKFYVMSRKMVLVPESLLLELKGKLPKSPEFQATLGLGYELDRIQDREDLNPEEKAGLYGQQLARYRHYLEKARSEGRSLSLPPATPTTASGEVKSSQPPAETGELDAKVIESVGKNMKKKASLLLDHLKKSKVLKWNAHGQVSYRGREVPNSNIVDLVSETMRMKSRKHHPQPAGLAQFAQALKEVNTPNEFVQNPDVIKAMLVPSKISTPKSAVDDEDQDDTGFHDASSLTPIGESFLETPRISKQRKKSYDIPFITPRKKTTHSSIKGWQALKK